MTASTESRPVAEHGVIGIDKNVPIPTGKIKYPFRQMEIGDSFFVAGATTTKLSSQMNITAKSIGNGCKFRSKTVDGGVRIWRIA